MQGKNWRTTVAGVLMALAMIIPQVQTLLDTDPTTNPDWSLIVAGISGALLGATSRDKKVSSKAMGLPGAGK